MREGVKRYKPPDVKHCIRPADQRRFFFFVTFSFVPATDVLRSPSILLSIETAHMFNPTTIIANM